MASSASVTSTTTTTIASSPHFNPQHSVYSIASQGSSSSSSFDIPTQQHTPSITPSHTPTSVPSVSTESHSSLHTTPSIQSQSMYPLIPSSAQVPSAIPPYQQPYFPSQAPLPSAFNYQSPGAYASQAFASPLQSQYPSAQHPGMAASSLAAAAAAHPYGAQGGLDPSQYRSYASAYNYPPYQQPPPGAWFP